MSKTFDLWSPETPVTPAAIRELFTTATVVAAIGDRTRYAVLRALAPGPAMSVGQLASRLRLQEDTLSKQLRTLRKTGVIRAVSPPGEDGRKQFYEIPAILRGRDAGGCLIVDLGWLVLRFA